MSYNQPHTFILLGKYGFLFLPPISGNTLEMHTPPPVRGWLVVLLLAKYSIPFMDKD
jgi:hypothetical protein